MNIYEFHQSQRSFSMIEVAADEELTVDIQKILIWLELLAPPVDGKFGPISLAALKDFQERLDCPEPGILDTATAAKLIETDPKELPPPELVLGNDLASRIIKYMQSNRYYIGIKPREYNIVYIEGMNPDGSENNDAPNQFNDLRMVIEFTNRQPKIVGNWEGTTEPGRHYTQFPITPYARKHGAARIQFGQYKAWQIGTHNSKKEPHEALVQVDPVTVHRDFNKDGFRTGDKLDTGLFGINQHHGFDYPRHDIGLAGAGCLVGRTRQGHRDFLALIKQDWRYQANPSYMFLTTIIPADKFLKAFPN